MAPDSPHVFRYEPALCTLAEGQTLSDWRRGDVPRHARRRRAAGLRARLLGTRKPAPPLSGR
jgi:hypothetical protein